MTANGQPTLLEKIKQPFGNGHLTVLDLRNGRNHRTITRQTRQVYDFLAGIYPLSTYFFHRRAHRHALEVSGIRDGMRVLEVATGSGEMFQKLVKINRHGRTVGLDLSPKMAAHTQRRARREFPGAWTHCQAVDARRLPFRDGSFDAIMSCYLLELLATDDVIQVIEEFRRVLAPGGRLTLVLIGANAEMFNRLYHAVGSVAPAFWGRTIERSVPMLMEQSEFRILSDRTVHQSGYPSRILAATR